MKNPHAWESMQGRIQYELDNLKPVIGSPFGSPQVLDKIEEVLELQRDMLELIKGELE